MSGKQQFAMKSEAWEKNWIKLDLRGICAAGNCHELEQEFDKWFAKGRNRFVLRCDPYMTLSIAAACVIVACFRRAQEEGGYGVLLSPGQPVRKTFETLGVLDLLEICANPHDVLAIGETQEKATAK